MKKMILALLMASFTLFCQAQNRITVGKTGVSFLSACQPSFDQAKSKDSSTVYNGECESGGNTYGLILVKLNQRRTDLNEAERITADYLQYLNQSFNITHAEGYQKGLQLNKDQRTRGIRDQWGDAQQNKWLVNAWTNGSFIAVLYTYGKVLSDEKANAFLNSLRFPQ